MATIIQVTGANETDEKARHEAFSRLNNLDTIVLTRLAELSQNKTTVSYLKTSDFVYKIFIRKLGL